MSHAVLCHWKAAARVDAAYPAYMQHCMRLVSIAMQEGISSDRTSKPERVSIATQEGVRKGQDLRKQAREDGATKVHACTFVVI